LSAGRRDDHHGYLTPTLGCADCALRAGFGSQPQLSASSGGLLAYTLALPGHRAYRLQPACHLPGVSAHEPASAQYSPSATGLSEGPPGAASA